jgi:flagellar hook-associated protein 2
MDVSSIYGLGYTPAASLINALYPTSSVSGISGLSGLASLLPLSGIQTSISTTGTLMNEVEALQSSAQKLADAGKFDARAVSSMNAKIATGSAAAGTANGSYAVEVRQLAQAQTLTTSAQASSLTPLGSGPATLSFTFASGQTKQVSLSGNDNTLAGMAASINSAGIGIEAKVVSTNNGYQLTMTGQTGSLNAFTVGVTGNAGVANLLAYSPGSSTGPTLTAAAQNAEGLINGNAFASGTNVVNTAAGLTLSLVSTGKTALSVAPDSGLAKTVSNFVSAYNAVQSSLTALGTDNSTLGLSAAYLRGSLSASLASPSDLAQVGITLNANGNLNFNEKTFAVSLAKSSANVASALGSSGLAGRISSLTEGSLSPGNLLKLTMPSLDYSGSLMTSGRNSAYSYLGQLGVLDNLGGGANLSSQWLLYGLSNSLSGNSTSSVGSSQFLQSLLAQQALNASLLSSH